MSRSHELKIFAFGSIFTFVIVWWPYEDPNTNIGIISYVMLYYFALHFVALPVLSIGAVCIVRIRYVLSLPTLTFLYATSYSTIITTIFGAILLCVGLLPLNSILVTFLSALVFFGVILAIDVHLSSSISLRYAHIRYIKGTYCDNSAVQVSDGLEVTANVNSSERRLIPIPAIRPQIAG